MDFIIVLVDVQITEFFSFFPCLLWESQLLRFFGLTCLKAIQLSMLASYFVYVVFHFHQLILSLLDPMNLQILFSLKDYIKPPIRRPTLLEKILHSTRNHPLWWIGVLRLIMSCSFASLYLMFHSLGQPTCEGNFSESYLKTFICKLGV